MHFLILIRTKRPRGDAAVAKSASDLSRTFGASINMDLFTLFPAQSPAGRGELAG